MCVKITLAQQTKSLPTNDLPSGSVRSLNSKRTSMDLCRYHSQSHSFPSFRGHCSPPLRLVLTQLSSVQRSLTLRRIHCSFSIPCYSQSREPPNFNVNNDPHRRRVGFPWDVPIFVSVKPSCNGRQHSDIQVTNVWVHPARESRHDGSALLKFEMGFDVETAVSSGNGEVPMTVTVVRQQRWFEGQMRIPRLSVSEILRQTVIESCSKLCQRAVSLDVWSVIYSYSPSQFWTLGEPSLFIERPLSDLGVPSGMIALNSRWKRALIIQSGWPSRTGRCRVKISDLWSVGSANDDQINQEFGGISLPVQIRPMPQGPSAIWYI